MKLDHDPNVKLWASEPFIIPYYDAVSKRKRRYIPDFYYETVTGDKYLIEIKPSTQCVPPTNSGKKSNKRLLKEHKTFLNNQSKWAYAQEFCKKRGVKFVVLTEKELFPKITRKRK
jgi:hypothetical protein